MLRFVVISSPRYEDTFVTDSGFEANAYLSQDCSSEELIHAVSGMDSVRRFRNSDDAFLPVPSDPRHNTESHILLTTKELRVLGLLARGGTNKEIARNLALSVNTVESRVARIYEKLGVSSRAEAVAQGLKGRLIDLD